MHIQKIMCTKLKENTVCLVKFNMNETIMQGGTGWQTGMEAPEDHPCHGMETTWK